MDGFSFSFNMFPKIHRENFVYKLMDLYELTLCVRIVIEKSLNMHNIRNY